ncbi:mechanosensitive ion channel [Ectothiorhodospira mobilis]|nr:mechanosensitive ion channel [Ectothiorhodospira mobilis]
MVVLAQVGINIGPLIAGAGVLGLAIGFGAQKLVQDVITGVFIQLENAFNVGDVVTAGGITGTVERLTIRSMGMRDLSGTYHLLPFSSVDTVSNYMRDFAFHVGEYGVAYREDTDEVLQRMNEAFEELRKMPEMAPHILGDLEVHGVTALADSAVNVRVRIKTRPGMQWAVGREYNRLVKRHFDAAGIEIPFPHMTLYFGEDKDGQAPPARVYMQGAASAPAAVEPSATPTASTPQLQPNPQFKGDFDEEEPNG